MIRAAAVLSLVTLLVLVLYVPSAHPPSRFLDQLRAEHESAIAFWGKQPAMRILDRAVRMQAGAAAVSPLPSADDAPLTSGIDHAVAREMGAVNQRLFNNRYFRSVDALLLLASYRLSSLLEWLPWLGVIALACALDGSLVRVIKAKEFLQHDPEMFALWCCLLIATACATVVAFVLPVQIHPAVLAFIPVALSILLGLAISTFHRRA